ncbi:MAG: hypothetical protein Kow0077_22310 [Anaerolineae bacterium]
MRSTTHLIMRLLLLALLALSALPTAAQGGNTISCGFEAPGFITDDAFVNEWALVLKQPQQVTLTATQTSGDVDPYLLLGSFEGDILAENDDGPDMGLNAQISLTLEAGRYTILVTRFGGEDGQSTGEYLLQVACAEPGSATTTTGGEAMGALYTDTFDSPGTWWVGTDENGEVWIEDGMLHVLNYTSAQYTANTNAGLDFGDFILTVDSTMLGGALDNWHYFSFRYLDAANHYRVGYSADGWFMGEVRRDGEIVEEWALPTQTSAIVQGLGATNQVRIEAIGNAVRFYVNDQLLIDTVVAPENAIPAGDIGLAVASMSGADYSEVGFDNLVIMAPGGAPPTTNVLFADDFSVDTGEWWLTSDERGDIAIQGGELVMRDVFDDIAFSTGPTVILDDFALEIDSRFVSGTDNNWHFIAFRLDDSGKDINYYRVGYSADGYVVGAEFANGQRIDWMDPTPSDAIIQGQGATNHLRLEVVGTQVKFYVNGQLVIDHIATNPLPAGGLWLSADALEAPDTTVAWDNLIVTAP